MKTISLIPGQTNLVSYRLEKNVEGRFVAWIAVFEYPDCWRTYDGRAWGVLPKDIIL